VQYRTPLPLAEHQQVLHSTLKACEGVQVNFGSLSSASVTCLSFAWESTGLGLVAVGFALSIWGEEFQLSSNLGVVAIGFASTTPGLMVGYSLYGGAVLEVVADPVFLEFLFLFLLDDGESFDESCSCGVCGVVGSNGAETLISGIGFTFLPSAARRFLIGSGSLFTLAELSRIFSGMTVVVARAGAGWNLWNF
jgi:hypothetical protein